GQARQSETTGAEGKEAAALFYRARRCRAFTSTTRAASRPTSIPGRAARYAFQVEERIVGFAHDADFPRDAAGELVETMDTDGKCRRIQGRRAPGGTGTV